MKQFTPNSRRSSGQNKPDFFIPESIRRRRLSSLPRSAELAAVLRKLHVTTLDDLNQVSLRDFRRLSDNGTALFLEITRLVGQVRQGDFAIAPSRNQGRNLAANHRGPLPDSAARKKGRIPDQARLELETDEQILIPIQSRGQFLATFPLSTRLRHVFAFKQFRTFGDLHGRSFSEICDYPNCGNKTIEEIRALVHAIQQSPQPPAAVVQLEETVSEAGSDPAAGLFQVPQEWHDLSVADLPLSVRLEGVLQRRGARCLGDIHGVSVDDLAKMKNCGRKTIAELAGLIERAVAGSFVEATDASWNPVELVRLLDALVADLPNRNKEMLILRLGGRNSDTIPTLGSVGAKFGLTRERIRQIMELSVERIRKRGSRRLRSYLEHVEGVCRDQVCPLTPALLKQWLGNPLTTGRFSLAFYVRLLAELNTTIPGWTTGRDLSRDESRHRYDIESALETALRRESEPLSLRQALAHVQAGIGLRKVEASEFLAALRHLGRFKVEFPQPDAPVVRLASSRPAFDPFR